MSQQPQDQTIEKILEALRDTPAPTGLEARIAHRLLQAQKAPAPTPTFFAVIQSFAKDLRLQLATATALAVALAIPLTHLHHDQPTIASHTTTPSTIHPTPNTVILSGVSRGILRETQSKGLPTARIPTAAQTLSTPTPDDPETIALAETLAPSQPIPTQPLTPQERLLLRATRQGQPIEVAELELAREPFLRAAAEARERFTFAQVARSLLAPLAEAESLEPKPSSADAPPAASTELQPPSPR